MTLINTDDFESIQFTRDGYFHTKDTYIRRILESKDKKMSFVFFSTGNVLAGVHTYGQYTAYYPLPEASIEYPIKAVLMDLDGTTLDSEPFWINVIEITMQELAKSPQFHLKEEDYPFVSGHSVSEHLRYCIDKYFPEEELRDAINIYYSVSKKQLDLLLNGSHTHSTIEPSYYLKEFLTYLSERGIKVGLVTSGLYEKAYPEIWAVCNSLELGTPEAVYNCIITAGYPLKDHQAGTLGELSAKPHPWLYLESAIVGLGIPLEDRRHILGIEDSGAGVCALRTAGIPVAGMKKGNIVSSGMQSMCIGMFNNLEEVKRHILDSSEQ